MSQIDTIIRNVLREDIGSGDVTSEATISKEAVLHGSFIAKESGVIAGIEIVRRICALFDKRIRFVAKVSDGAKVRPGTVIARIEGLGRSLLAIERVTLNFLQRMSGIATQTRKLVDAAKGSRVVILDTRKTAPGLRYFDKSAVKIGGGQNHRFGLFDMVLIKDNHIAAVGSITQAIQAVRRVTKLPIEVEVKNLKELKEALRLRPNRIMLDNMVISQMRQAVSITKRKVPLEASGRVTLKNVRMIAQTGVDYISVGSLTHSVSALDISLEVQ